MIVPYEYPITPKQARVVFIIDDEPMQLQMMKDHLAGKFVLEIHDFTSGEAALKNLHLQPEVVILDYHLQTDGGDAETGVEVLKKIKEKLPLTQVIMLSGQDKIAVSVACMKNGAYDYIVKGESAFARIENIFTNIDEMMDSIYSRKFYKDLSTILISLMVIGGIFTLYSVYAGWAVIDFHF